MVRVSSYARILARTGSFISANTSEIPRALIASSRSSSMSAAVVSTSVIGSAAIRIQTGVEAEHDQSGKHLSIGIACHVVVAGQVLHATEHGVVGQPGAK